MQNKFFPVSGLPIRRSVELLPKVFQTLPNKKFLEAIVDPLIQPGQLEKLSGYVGRKYGKTYNSSDVYIDDAFTLRSKYQLEPGVVIENNGTITNFYDYIDFKNQLKFFGNDIDRDDRINTDEHYSWAPPIEWDKFVNYREYYWLPDGPLPITVSGEQTTSVVTKYKVRANGQYEWIFSPDGLKKNPDVKLFRGQTYYFEVNSPGDNFFIRTSAVDGSSSNYHDGVTNNGTAAGTIEFTVPYNAPDILYYQSESERNRFGSFRIYDIATTSTINVTDSIIGAKEFTSANGIVFANGLKIKFSGTVTPEKYATGQWYVEGVGDAIKLVSLQDLELPILNTTNPEVLFDVDAFDSVPFDDATSYPTQKDYITINRSSIDNNSWSRYNRWFHRSVIDYSNSVNGTIQTLAETARAKRPIIEFKSDLQLFNHGAVAKQSVDLVDTECTDVFSTIEGKANYNIDGVDLYEGARVLFVADTDPLVQNKIYKVTFVTLQTSPVYDTNTTNAVINGVIRETITGIKRQISLVEVDDTYPQIGECVYVKKGNVNRGNMFHYNNSGWILSQVKTSVQQAPLFDAFDNNGIAFSDSIVYPVSSFSGSKIISYITGTSSVTDTELGFKLSYLNIDNIGDIQFNFDFDNDTFTWQKTIKDTVTEDVNSGFFKFNSNLTDYSLSNGWIHANGTYIQPIIDSISVTTATNTFNLTTCIWDEATREKYVIYVNEKLVKTGWVVAPSTLNPNTRVLTFTNALAVSDTVTIKLFTDATPDTGYYEIPMGLEKNPTNLDLASFTLGEITDHLGSIFEIDERLTGTFPGISNLKDVSGIEVYGRRFVKHSGLMPAALSLLCDKDLNIVKSIRYAKSEYTKFKNNLMQLSVELPYNLDPAQMLDDVIAELSVGKNEHSAFFGSDMIGAGPATVIDYIVEDAGIKVFALSQKFDLLTQSDRAVYVYVNDVQLVNGTDYSFDSLFGFVKLLVTLSEGDEIKIKEYNSTAYNFVPPTPTKLGLYKVYVPEIYTDTTYKTPQVVIRGHDGSITMSYGDFRDDILLEFEKRVYNNLKLEYNESILHIDSTFGGYYGNALYTKAEADSILREDYLNWISDTDTDIVNNVYFDDYDSFTYTYSNSTDTAETATLPGWWRGVYQWYYDTDAPHSRPWEMQGFATKPTWWESEYGAAPYTAGNLLLWEDIRDGIIRQGDRQNLKGEARYARPTILSHLPVDADGNLLSPLASNLAANFSLVLANRPFVFGDMSPAESAWRKSSEYPFAQLVALSLLTPCDFISKSFNRLAITRNTIGQLVNTNTNKFLTPTDFEFTSFTGTANLFGTVNYVIALLASQSKDAKLVSTKLSNLDVRLSNRLSGFVDKAQFNYVLDSRTPQSASSSIYVPPENFDIIFNVSSPILSIVYSGVIIEKRADGWKISGYDKLNPVFKYNPAISTNADYLISVGGVTENFLTWSENKFYGKGIIVSWENAYYRAKENHTSTDTFQTTKWQSISKLPVVGAIEAFYRSQFDMFAASDLAYGTVLGSVQEVVDFLYGYGQYLTSQGLVFDGYDTDIQVARDWTTSVKEFLYWTSHNWSVGSILTLSPAAEELKVDIQLGTVDNLLDSFYDYSVLRSDGTRLSVNYLSVDRDFQRYTLSTFDTPDGIYFARLNFVVKEHVAVFNDRTVFNDVIYDPEPGYRQERIKIVGYRTIEWDGDYTSPGFLFDDAQVASWAPYTDYQLGDIVRYKDFYYTSQRFQQGTLDFNYDNWTKTDQLPTQGLVTNYDYRINQFDDYYDLDAAGVQSSQRDLARHAIGYQPRQYLENIAQDEISQYKLYQGFIREKGTANSITKIFDKLTRTDQPGIVLNEEWAFRVGRFGGIDQVNEYEFKLSKADFKLNPQPILLLDGTIPNTYVDNYIRLNDTKFIKYPGSYTTSIIPTAAFEATARSAGYVKSSDVDFVIKNREDLLTLDFTKFVDKSTVWITFDDTILNNQSWTVLRYNLSHIVIDTVSKDSAAKTATITTSQYHDIVVDDIIGINNVKNLTGFFKVTAVGLNTITLDYTGTGEVTIEDSVFVPIGTFETARFSTTEDLDQVKFAKMPTNSKLWIDNGSAGGWEVLTRTKQYTPLAVEDYGPAAPENLGTATVYAETADKIVSSMPASNTVGIFVKGINGLTPGQQLMIPVGFETAFTGKFGETLAVSSDGRWIAVGIPSASAVPSYYSGVYQPADDYNAGSVVRANGKLWKSTGFIHGDAGNPSIQNTNFVPTTLNNGDGAAPLLQVGATFTNQGAIAIYENTENFGNFKGVWNSATTYYENDVVNRNGYFYKLIESIQTVRTVTSTNEDPSNPYSTITNPPELNPKVWQTIGAVNQWFFSNVIISPKPDDGEHFGSTISINGSGDSYWMTVSASGSENVYLYRYVNGAWTQLEDNYYRGVYDSAHPGPYNPDDIVFYGNSFYKAKTTVPANTDPTDATKWVAVPSYSDQGMLPTNAASEDSTYVLPAGFIGGLVEEIKFGDKFGSTTDISQTGEYLVVGAPNSDGKYFAQYKGVWNYYQAYAVNDVVKYNNQYYKATVAQEASLNDATLFPYANWTTQGSVQNNPSSGKVIIYKRNSSNVYECVQVISNENLAEIADIHLISITQADLIKNNDGFGTQVKFNSDATKLFVSSPNADVNGQDKGRVFVFSLINGTYTLVQTIFSPSDIYNEKFGTSLAVSKTGNTLIVGAKNGRSKTSLYFDDYTTTFDLGSTTIYKTVGTTGTVWAYDFVDTQYVLGEELKVDDVKSNENFGISLGCSDSAVAIGSPFYTDASGATTGRLFKFTRTKNAASWYPSEVQQSLVNIDLLKSLFVYNPVTEKKIADIDIIDPFKLKILGIAEEEISFKTPYDPAIYSVGTATSQVDEQAAWLDRHIGEVWWDVSTAKWAWYEQGDAAFKIGNWGKLAYGASIDVYEWVESVYSPSTWAALSGTADGLAQGISGQPYIADDTTLSYKQNVDSITGLVSSTLFYFWVKNKVAAPAGIAHRKMSVSEIATLIKEPELSGIPIIGLTGSSSLIGYNIQPIIDANTCVLNIQFDKQLRGINLEHNEYQLLTEGVADSLPSAKLETKWIDSLIGADAQGNSVPDPALPDNKKYGIEYRPRQTMFVDKQAALGVVIKNVNSVLAQQPFADLIDFDTLNLVDKAPDITTRLYDIVVETEIDLTAVGTYKLKSAELKANIVNGEIISVTVVDAGYGYKYPPKIEIRGSGIGATVEVDPLLINQTTGRLHDNRGKITSVIVTNKGKKYTSALVVPRSFSALVTNLVGVNEAWSIYSFDSSLGQFFRSRTQAFDTTKYWSYIDWWMSGYSSTSRISATIPALYAESEVSLSTGQLLRVSEYGTGGWAILERVEATSADILGKYRLVGKHQGTIEIDTTLSNPIKNKSGYDSGPYYDNSIYDQNPTVELRNIFKAIKNDIFVNDLRVEWNKLFFTSIQYALSEQIYVDWVFKTSFLNAIHNVGNLEKKPTYQNDNLDSYKEYVNEVKPYRTKVREFTSRYLSLDNTETFTSDFDMPSAYNADTNKIEAVTKYSDYINQYPWKAWADNNGYVITDLKVASGGGGYITPPVVVFTGGGGSGAKAVAYIRAGAVSLLELINPGHGYTSAPTVTLVGGNGDGAAGVAKAVAVIGNGLVRSIAMAVKFDRYSKTGRYTNTSVSETFTGTGAKTVFELKYPPTSDRDKVVVLIDGNQSLRSDFKAVTYTSGVNKTSVLKGKIVFDTAPESDSIVTITYEKNTDVFDAINRINKHYSPVAGMLGKDPSQLMTGIDYGGVIVQGTTFDVSGGWDALPWFTEGWDTTIPVFSDFYYVMPAKPIPLTVLTASGNGTIATLTFATQTTKFKLGSYVTVENMDRSGYNGTFVVTASTTSSVTFLNSTIGDSTGGTVVKILEVEQPAVVALDHTITIYKKKKVRSNPVVADGFVTDFDIPETVDAPIVFVNGVEKYLTTDYFIADNMVRFFIAPSINSEVVIETYDAPVRLDVAGGSMTSFVGDGITNLIQIPNNVDYGANDIFIFRPEESDGSLSIVDKNLLDANVSGGEFGSYITANGTTPEEIVIEGDSFISPDQVPAPEENIPGQVLESVSIKVFQSDISGAPEMVTRVYTTSSSVIDYAIGQSVFEPANVFVLLDKVPATLGTDYTINFANNTIEFIAATPNGLILEIKSIGIAGAGILDYQEFTGDGATKFFLTKALYSATNAVIATVDGVETPVAFSNSNGKINKLNNTFVQLGAAPATGSIIKIVCVKSPTSLVQIYSQEFVLDTGTSDYLLDGFVANTGPLRSNVIVEIDGMALLPPDNSFAIFNGTNNQLTIGADPLTSSASIPLEHIRVYVNNLPIEYINDWSYNPDTKTVEFKAAKLSKGDHLLVELSNTGKYSMVGNAIAIDNSVAYTNGQTLSVTWFKNYENLQMIRDVFAGGKYSYPLQTVPNGISYIWVYLNGEPLTQNIDFELDNTNSIVHLRETTVITDRIQIITYGVVTRKPSMTFEIFKDMLNRHQFKRGAITTLALARELTYYATEIQVNDASVLPDSGVIVINSERIEYRLKTGNLLTQLRRGVFGTPVAELHARLSKVVDVSDAETLPYAERQSKFDFYGNGIRKVFGPLPFTPTKTSQAAAWYTNSDIPATFAQCNDVEVFVSGRRLIKTSTALFNEADPTNDIIIPAEFSVDGITKSIRITTPPPAGARVTIIQRQGSSWYNNTSNEIPLSLSQSNTPVAKFIQQRPSLLPSFDASNTDILNTESGDSIDDENGNPIEF